MNWLRDKLRLWLEIYNGPSVEQINEWYALLLAAEGEIVQLRTELDALKGEVRARNPQPQQVSFRISVDDYETSQLKALEEFKDQKGSV